MISETASVMDAVGQDQADGGDWALAARIVFPDKGEEEKIPLYIDFGSDRPTDDAVRATQKNQLGRRHSDVVTQVGPSAEQSHLGLVRSRRSLNIPEGLRVSFATIMNAFPASYWRHWTPIEGVRLRLVLRGSVSVLVYRSNAQGRAQRVDLAQVDNALDEEVVCDLDLKTFVDGGWYWFDLTGGQGGATLVEGAWLVSGQRRDQARLSVGITTFNRPDYCAETLIALGSSPTLMERIDRIYVVDQGNKYVTDDSQFPKVQELLGDHLRMIRQGNLGGSGGFARGMYESVTAGESGYHLVLDDDVQIEPEGIERTLTFAQFCRKPSIVGGMMFDLFDRSVLHSWGEQINRYHWKYGTPDGFEEDVDLGTHRLRSTPWMHRRLDVDYNAWWMCMIPTETIREIGLALPVFIKWDDAEYGLRAQRAGVPTITLPGAAIWHMSWADKDDTIDWQAYFHERNRLVTCLIYSPYRYGGRLPLNLVARDMKHAVSSEYYAQAARILALKDVLSGPEHLHATIGVRAGELRAMTKEYPQSTFKSDPAEFPEVDRNRPWRHGQLPKPPSAAMLLPWTLKTAIRQLLPVKKESLQRPQAALPHSKASFWMVSHFDSVLVSKADGTGTAWYKRDPKMFREQLAEEARLRSEVIARWTALSEEYRQALPHFTSRTEWEKTFGIDGSADE